ncbi:MAG TPA: type II secretion system F family protein [Tepidisphaeraceae bacterium]|nr:type II secretion system F family protein [Tepidisphaeraceae bacterium]
MAVFTYTALDRSGKRTTGTVPAESRSSAMDQVLSRGLSPLTVQEQAAGANGATKSLFSRNTTTTRVPQAALESFTRELANLLGAGLPLSKALHLLRREAAHPGAKNVWNKIHEDVVGGESLADALNKWPKTFSTVYVAMVRAGEAGGFLHVVLQQIADFRTREADLKGKVKAALVYPVVLGVFAACVLTFLLTFFIPKFSGIFADFGAKLPYLTQVVVMVSNILIHYGWMVAIAIVVGVVLGRKAMTSEKGRRIFEQAVLKTPALGQVSARFALVRFCRMLGTLVGAGVPLVSSLKTAKESLGNQTLSDAVSHAVEEVQRGAPLSRSLAATPILFPPSVVEMVAIAEETGRLDKELQRLSVTYEAELDRNLRMLVSLAEPLMLFLTAVVIGVVVVAMLLPILTLQDVVH